MTIWIFGFPVDIYPLQLDFMKKFQENLATVKDFLEQCLLIPGSTSKLIKFRWLGVFEQMPKILSHQNKTNVKIDLASMQDE
uniref:Uncharacterized protein n=1 Tax=Romanomermis culicivorax TaxID=13658 RepID=A0A915J4C6_ROMCU